jgi:nucleotidyltransferase substrate binding protein (TIGR01987 family)
MALSHSDLRKALELLDQYQKAVAQAGPDTDPILLEAARAGVVQHFEIAYESSWKLIQRWLQENGKREQAETPRSRADLFREAARSGLIDNPLQWIDYAKARNLTSHTYDKRDAQVAFDLAEPFVKDATRLLENLAARHD